MDPVTRGTLWQGGVGVVGGALGRGLLDHVHIGHGEDALLVGLWDLPLIPVLVHLSQQDHPLTLSDIEITRSLICLFQMPIYFGDSIYLPQYLPQNDIVKW